MMCLHGPSGMGKTPALDVAGILTGVCTLAPSTVTAKGEPRVSAVDGHFLHGKWHFGTARGAAKARHLAARPAAGAADLRGEELGVRTHGTVETFNSQDGEAAADWPDLLGIPHGLPRRRRRRRRLRLGGGRRLLPSASALDDRVRP